jgi:hypothetical protein
MKMCVALWGMRILHMKLDVSNTALRAAHAEREEARRLVSAGVLLSSEASVVHRFPFCTGLLQLGARNDDSCLAVLWRQRRNLLSILHTFG